MNNEITEKFEKWIKMNYSKYELPKDIDLSESISYTINGVCYGPITIVDIPEEFMNRHMEKTDLQELKKEVNQLLINELIGNYCYQLNSAEKILKEARVIITDDIVTVIFKPGMTKKYRIENVKRIVAI